jgi:hypothetical protein
MSLMQLLAATRSIKTVKNEPSPYKMNQTNLLPKFVKKGEDGVLPAEETAPAGLSESESKAAIASEPRDFPQPVVQGFGRKRVLTGWLAFRKKLRKPSAKSAALVQTELSLEGVKVVRNDLYECGAEKKSAPAGLSRSRGGEPQTRAVWRNWWTRLQARLFARKRDEDGVG